MADKPHIAQSACKYGIDHLDVYSVLDDPLFVATMPEVIEMAAQSGVVLDQEERPNVDVFAGRDSSGYDLVVFVDRFNKVAFHSEPGHRRFTCVRRLAVTHAPAKAGQPSREAPRQVSSSSTSRP